MTITLAHARKAGYCNKGMRLWFKAHGFDFNQFRRQGIDEFDLIGTGDKQAIKLVEIAHGR